MSPPEKSPANTLRFIDRVWHFNAYVIAIAGLIAIIVGALALYSFGQSMFRTRHVSGIATTASPIPANSNERRLAVAPVALTIGSFTPIRGTSILRAPLISKETRTRSGATRTRTLRSYSKIATASRNYLFYNGKTGKSYRLLPKDNQIILHEFLVEPPRRPGNFPAPRPVLALLYQIVETDSNEDGILSARDQSILVVARPDGRPQLTIRNVKSLRAIHVIEGNELILLIGKPAAIAGKNRDPLTKTNDLIDAVHISLSDFKITRRQTITK